MNRIFLLGALALCLAFAGYALDAAAPVGIWTVQSGKARVEITQTPQNTLEGKIIWMQEPTYPEGDKEAGKAKHDRKNPDAALRDRPILGLKVLEGFTFNGKDAWKGGTIYDAETGKTYKCNISFNDKGQLEVRGYVGISLIGRTDLWTRYTPEK